MQKTSLEFDSRSILAVLFSCFGFCQIFLQRYNEMTWVYLMGLGIGLSLILMFKKKLVLPDNKILYFILFSFSVTALQSLLNGSHLIEERWVTRYMTLFIVFLFYQLFNEDDNFASIAWPFLFFFSLLSGWSLFQYIFLYNINSEHAFATFGSRLWNISYYAQAVCLALPFLSYFKNRNKSFTFSIYLDITTIFILITLFASQSRASLIGLFLYLLMEFIKPVGFSRKKILTLIIGSFFINTLIWHFKAIDGEPYSGSKERSFAIRKNLISASLEMSKDFPTGVGPDRFRSMLNLYFDKDKPFSGEHTDITKTPHSEFFQVLTEDGWAIAIIYLISLIYFLVTSIMGFLNPPTANAIFPRFFICLLPQMAFHFPFDLYIPVILFSLSFAQFFKIKITMTFTKSLKYILLILGLILFSIHFIRQFRVVSNEYAVPYCSVFHDNYEVCKIYFREFYLIHDFSRANEIARPISKYQTPFYGTLAMDYSLGVEPRSQIAACIYYDTFNGNYKIPDSPTEHCTLTQDKNKKIEIINEYIEQR